MNGSHKPAPNGTLGVVKVLRVKMSITVEVRQLSDKTVTVHAGLNEEMGTMTRRAQIALGVGRGRHVGSPGSVLDASAAIKRARLQNGRVNRVTVHACHGAFAAVLGDGSVVTRGGAGMVTVVPYKIS